MPFNGLRAAANLLAPGAYPDRFAMFAALSDRLARLDLLVDALPPALAPIAAAHPRLRVVPLGPRRFARRAADWLHPRLEAGALDVVHDTFGHLAEVFEAHGPDPRRTARLLTTLYTSNQAWFGRVRHRGMDLGRRYVAQRIISLWRDLRLCPMADRVVVLGPGHEADVAALGVPPGRICWLPSEIDTARFTPAVAAPAADGPRLLFTGAVWRNKGVDLLLDIAPALAERHPGLRLELVGHVVPWERDWLARAAAACPLGDRLDLPGRLPRDALIARYRRADLFVFPSLFEGSPRSVREAVACGCRAVVADIPGCRGIDPEGAFLRFAPPGDRAAWLDAIDALLREPAAAAEDRRRRGRAHLEMHHRPAAVAERYAALYATLCAAPPWSAMA